MRSSSSSSALLSLPIPGSPGSSWATYRSRLVSPPARTVAAFFLLGLINNVLYVIVLSAAQDLVGDAVPKGAVLLADVLPSFGTKLLAPYFVHKIPHKTRVPVLVALSAGGMLLVAVAGSVAGRLTGVAVASVSSGGGELSFLGMTHYFGAASLAAWGSGTGAAGLLGAALYVVWTEWWQWGIRGSLLAAAGLPILMLLAFFVVLPRGGLEEAGGRGTGHKEYEWVAVEEGAHDDDADAESEHDEAVVSQDQVADTHPTGPVAADPVVPGSTAVYEIMSSTATPTTSPNSFTAHLRRARALFLPYMLPLLLVYVAEYTINQGVAPTLLFPLDGSHGLTPFSEYRAYYPFYGFLYQLGVFISRSSTPWVRIRNLYLPSLLQVANLALLTAHAVWDFLPSVYVVFVVVLWEGLLGGAVYVNTFAAIMERVPLQEREFSLGATSVSDSGGICIAGLVGMVMEVWLCERQVRQGRDYCRRIDRG